MPGNGYDINDEFTSDYDHKCTADEFYIDLHKQKDSQFEQDIAEFKAVNHRLSIAGSDESVALIRVRDIRTRRLAHSLIDKYPDDLPYYRDLSLLLETAKKAVSAAALAIDGLNTSFNDYAASTRVNAKAFARCIAYGLKNFTIC